MKTLSDRAALAATCTQIVRRGGTDCAAKERILTALEIELSGARIDNPMSNQIEGCVHATVARRRRVETEPVIPTWLLSTPRHSTHKL